MIHYLALWLRNTTPAVQFKWVSNGDRYSWLPCMPRLQQWQLIAFIRSGGLGGPLQMLRQVILYLTFEPYFEMIGHGAAVSECMGSMWASGAIQVYAHVASTLRTILHVDGETTLWITTSDPYCCQLNQRYTTCYMEQPHDCNEQLVYQPTWTDVTGLSLRKVKVRPVCRIIG